MKTKKCSRCGVEKPLNEFYPRLLSKYEYKPRKNEDTREKCIF